ncbi:UNVERIFIED_CONTAM: hypothetical protein HDU68_011244 [Siphonaria sp. JEL0065]|nr:hypothetical protein HDU68_011244 [Siphonaria sp. JEL0065]
MMYLPAELAEQIIKYLPIDEHLQSLGFSFKSFGTTIFYSHHSANSHLKIVDPKSLETIIKTMAIWTSLSFPYKCAVYNYFSTATSCGNEWIRLPITPALGMKLHQYYVTTNPAAHFSFRYVMAATTRGLLDVLKLVYVQGTVLNISRTILFNRALDKGYCNIVEYFMDLPHFDPADNDGSLLISLCHYNNTRPFIQRILRDPRIDKYFIVASRGALQVAIENGHYDTFITLMDDPRILTIEQQTNQSLCTAINQGKEDIVQFLVNLPTFDPSINICGAFVAACQAGNAGLVSLCLNDNRVDPSTVNDCLYDAVRGGHVQVAKLLLLDGRVDPLTPDNDDCLITTCLKGYFEVAQLLLQDGRVDPSTEESAAVLYACDNNRLDILRLLLADSRVNPAAGLRAASIRGYSEIVHELLLDSRVGPESGTWMSAIDCAAKKGHVDVIKQFLRDSRVDPLPFVLNAKVEWFGSVADDLVDDTRLEPHIKEAVSRLKLVCVGHWKREQELNSANDIVQSYKKRKEERIVANTRLEAILKEIIM